LAKTAPEFFNSYNQGFHAKTWKEMDSATTKFGQATGSLAVDSAIGFAGYHFGVRIASGGTAATASKTKPTEFAEHTGTKDARSRQDGGNGKDVGNGKEVQTEKDLLAKANDATPLVNREVSAEHTISMKDLAERDPARFEKILEEYYPKLERAFPDASEIESMATYRKYLKDKDFSWDMLVLHDKKGNVLGGIQSQIVDVGGDAVKRAFYGEHIWLDPEARTFGNFNKLLKIAQEKWSKSDSDIVFMEFNDRAKMSLQQQNDDAAAGLSPEAREKIWGRVGLSVLGDESNRLAPYAQPAMGEGKPVNYLSLAFGSPKGETLNGQTMSISDYTKLLQAAHAAIPNINLKTDPTVLRYTAELEKLVRDGETHFSFTPLRDTEIARLTPKRFIDE